MLKSRKKRKELSFFMQEIQSCIQYKIYRKKHRKKQMFTVDKTCQTTIMKYKLYLI